MVHRLAQIAVVLALTALLASSAWAEVLEPPEAVTPASDPARAPARAPAPVPVRAPVPAPVPAAVTPANTTVFFELFGSGLFMSLNIERLIDQKVAIRAGTFCIPGTELRCPGLVPVTLSWLVGDTPSKLELGAGVVLLASRGGFGDGNRPDQLGTFARTAIIGWRWLPRDGGWMWRIAWTPIVNAAVLSEDLVPWAGIAGGYAF